MDRVTCVLSAATQMVTCFGDGSRGLLGKGATYTVFPLSSSSPVIFDRQSVTVVQISGVFAHACALFTNGKVRCWGQNWFGELGAGHARETVGTSPSDISSIRFISFSDPSSVVAQVSAGGAHTCALFAVPAGKVICWGRGDSGQLGLGMRLEGKGLSPTDISSLPFISFSSSDLATGVSAGGHHTCALFTSRARCWGNNDHGQLGTDNTFSLGSSLPTMMSLSFIQFSDTAPLAQVSAGNAHTCVVVGSGRTRCFGSGAKGSLGLDSTLNWGDTPKSMQTLPFTKLPIYATPVAGFTTGGTAITLTGTFRAANAKARFWSESCPSFADAATSSPLADVSVVLSPAWPCGPGPVNVSVSAASAAIFYYVSPYAAIDGVNPTGWTVGDAVPITVTGSNLTFTPVARCRFGPNSTSALTVTSAETAVCQSPSSPYAGDGLLFSFSLDGSSFVQTDLRVVILCRSEQFKDAESRCAYCPENTFSAGATGLSSCVCKPGFFTKSLRSGVPCLECPKGASCDGGTKAPRPIYGHWSSGADPFTIFRCVPERACSGGVDECSDGFEGRICTTCRPGFFRSSGDCIRCPSGSKGIVVAAALSVVVIAALFLAMRGVRRSKAAGGTLSIATKYFQVLMVVGRLNVSWPKRLRDTLDAVTSPLSFKLDGVGLECSDVKIAYEVKWALTMLLPVFFALAFALAYGLFQAWSWVRRRPGPAELKDRAVNAYLSVISLGFLTLAATALEPFACVEKEDGSWMMVANPSQLCHDGRWWRLAGWAAIAVLLYVVAIPVGLFFFFRKNRARLGEDVRFGDRFSGLYANYVPSLAHVWEPVVMLEKVVIACVGLFLAGFAMLQALLLLLLLVVTLSLYQTFAPYARENDNKLHAILRWCSIVVLGAGMLFCADKFPSDRARFSFEWLAVVVIIASTVMVAAALALNLWTLRISIKTGLSKELEACLALFTRFGRTEVSDWLLRCPADLRSRMQAVLEALSDKSDGALMEMCPVSMMAVAEDPQADQLVITFTRGVFRSDVVPLVRTWLTTSQDNERVDDFVECFAAFAHSQHNRCAAREQGSPAPVVTTAHRQLLSKLYGHGHAQAAIEIENEVEARRLAACLTREGWRESFHILFLESHLWRSEGKETSHSC